MPACIELYGCREGNLKGINLKLPYNKLIVITGVSGAGKSSLAFKTIFAEGRRRIIESLDPRESYFLSYACAPKVDLAIGLPPAIAIRQSQYIRSPRSTVGSISHLLPFLYVLFATCGDIPCEVCASRGQSVYNPAHATRCRRCGIRIAQLQPGAFSNQSPVGMCPECGGTGVIEDIDETAIYPNQELSIAQGGLAYGGPRPNTMKWTFFARFLGQFGFDLDTPIKDLSQEAKVALLFGVKRSRKYKVEFPGIVPEIKKRLKETRSERLRRELRRFVVETRCAACDGLGIGRLAASVRLGGQTVSEVLQMNVVSLIKKLEQLKFGDVRDQIAAMPLKKMLETARIMHDMGIGYLTLARKTASLSGGEMQRACMAAQLATQISGVVYVIDEPSTGLHAVEIEALIKVLHRLRDSGSGNTVVVVEHDAQIIRRADYVVELGPGPSRKGGRVVSQGAPEYVAKCSGAVTAEVLQLDGAHIERARRAISDRKLGIRNACSNNLKNVSVDIPLNVFVCIVGISGSGKSSLVFDSLCAHASAKTSKGRATRECDLLGREFISDIVLCDQAPISRSTRSVVATYAKVFALLRNLFAGTPSARRLGLDAGHFSFNTRRGACQTCGGFGTIAPSNTLLGGAEFVCPECGGRRFNEKVLSVRYRGYSIGDVLDMDVAEARCVFADQPAIERKLAILDSIGLGHLLLGQSSLDLSGGEAQRLKVAVDLMGRRRTGAVYVFDEPTVGLHLRDIRRLIGMIDQLLDSAHSVIVVEHNLDLIWASDYVIEMGPGAGEAGGEVLAQGTPSELARLKTPTGRALARFIKARHASRSRVSS